MFPKPPVAAIDRRGPQAALMESQRALVDGEVASGSHLPFFRLARPRFALLKSCPAKFQPSSHYNTGPSAAKSSPGRRQEKPAPVAVAPVNLCFPQQTRDLQPARLGGLSGGPRPQSLGPLGQFWGMGAISGSGVDFAEVYCATVFSSFCAEGGTFWVWPGAEAIRR